MSEAARVTITLPDGTQKQVPAGMTVANFVRTQIGPGLAKVALFARYDDADIDLSMPLDHDGRLSVYTPKDPQSLELLRHDAAHIVASVVQRLFPGTQVTIGPSTDEGFYYDFGPRPAEARRIHRADETRSRDPVLSTQPSRRTCTPRSVPHMEAFHPETIEGRRAFPQRRSCRTTSSNPLRTRRSRE